MFCILQQKYNSNLSVMRAIHLVIHGKVQGVFFRKHALEKANDLGLKGIVRNLPNGNVEIFAEGYDFRLKELIEWCHIGSPNSKVERVIVHDIAFFGYEQFLIAI
jgi:acylphosphatase